jgi:Spy/CpxP family protein refolding chaperone
MNRLGPFVVALAVVASASSHAFAQRPGRGGGFGGFGGPGANSLGLLAQQSVQDELKLSDEQKKQVAEHVEKQRAAMGELQGLERAERQTKMQERIKANDAAVSTILNADQAKRFKQISLQQRGPLAFADPEVATALGFTSEQKDKIKAVQDSAQSELRGLFQGGAGGGDREEARKKMDALRTSSNEKLQSLLTPEQQEKWKSLTGDPFKGEIRRPQPGRNRPGANARPNRRPNRRTDVNAERKV